MNLTKTLTITLIVNFLTITITPQDGAIKLVKLSKFYLQSSHVIPQSGEELSSGKYKNDVYWLPVNVPSTVLTGLVANKVYPDPCLGLNNMLIPDASDEFDAFHHDIG